MSVPQSTEGVTFDTLLPSSIKLPDIVPTFENDEAARVAGCDSGDLYKRLDGTIWPVAPEHFTIDTESCD